jgi:hypothetical protein
LKTNAAMPLSQDGLRRYIIAECERNSIMGTSLKLLPLLSPGHWVSHDILRVDPFFDLWPIINALPQLDIPTPLSCYEARTKNKGKPCYGSVETDAGGQRLKWVTAQQLLTIKDHERIAGNWRNRAVWAYLANMPDASPIVLYWS